MQAFNRAYRGRGPDLLARILVSARAVLDIGYGIGALSGTIKLRQAAHVVGMELVLVPEMAEQARTR